jgi:hypothetical protein
VIIFAISLVNFAALRPYLLKQTVDGYIATQDQQGLMYHPDGNCALLEVFSHYFVYWELARSDIVKTLDETVSTHFEFPNEIF